MKRTHWILLVLLLVLFIGGGTALYMFNKPHKNIEEAKADVSVTAQELVQQFIDNENDANALYLNKVIEVNGRLVGLDYNSSGKGMLTLVQQEDGLSATFDSAYVVGHLNEFKELAPGTEVKVKGRCDGYMMLNGVSLNKCSFVKE